MSSSQIGNEPVVGDRARHTFIAAMSSRKRIKKEVVKTEGADANEAEVA